MIYFILRKHYTTATPTSWMLQELAAHSLTTNTKIVSKQMKGDSRKWPIWAGEISRNSFRQIDGDKQGAPCWEDPKFRLTNIREKSAGGGLKVALSTEDRKRLTKSPPSKGGVAKLKVEKSDKDQRKRERMLMEMEICL